MITVEKCHLEPPAVGHNRCGVVLVDRHLLVVEDPHSKLPGLLVVSILVSRLQRWTLAVFDRSALFRRDGDEIIWETHDRGPGVFGLEEDSSVVAWMMLDPGLTSSTAFRDTFNDRHSSIRSWVVLPVDLYPSAQIMSSAVEVNN